MADLKISQLTGATTPLAGTEVLPIVQSGSTRQVSVANLTAGRTQTSNGIVQGTAGTGYNFTANTAAAGMTSQLLNWYEEGTFTPTYTSDGTPPTCTYAVQDAKYTRIGRMVYFSIEIRTDTASGGTGNLGVAGLPFTSKNDRYSGTTNVGFAYAFTTQCPTTGYIPANSTTLYLCFKTSATEISNISAGYLTNAAASNYLLISGSYVV